MEPLTLVLVGRTGNGKSATGSSILKKQQAFVSQRKTAAVTKTCEVLSTTRPDGRVIRVMDTRGFFEVGRSPEEVKAEIGNCVGYAKDGIHAMLLVLSTRNRLTMEEVAVVDAMQVLFGAKVLRFAILVFTAAEELEDQSLDDFCEDGPEALVELLNKCGRRVIGFDNKAMDESSKERQVTQLLRIVDDLVRQNGGKPYTNELFQQAKSAAEKQREEQQKLETGRTQGMDISLLKQQMELAMAEQMKSLTDNIRLRLALAEERAAQRNANPQGFNPPPGIMVPCSIM